jgi:two-component system sensor histidine kinase PilS (NtrC family)
VPAQKKKRREADADWDPDSPQALHVDPAWGTLYALSLARVLITAFVLLSAIIFATPLVGRAGPANDLVPALLAYFCLAIFAALASLFYRRHFLGQLTSQLGGDLIMATVLVVLGGGMRSEFVVLYLIPIAGGSLMLPTSAAFFTASIAVIILLSDALLRGLREDHADPQLFQAGLYGAALFGITGLLRLLSVRLNRQEQLAYVRGLDLQNQLEINRLVISQMEQGVIVVDAGTTVRANNLAARELLGMARSAQLTGRRLLDVPALQALGEEFLLWKMTDTGDAAWSDLVFTPGPMAEIDDAVAAAAPGGASMGPASRPLRARFARPPSPQSGEFVIFLEDRNALEARAQQLKLAAMGRLTASIAHEIRNPLAAISNAGQLLAEDARDAMQKRLAGIVRENTTRLNRLVEDVLRVARREPPLSDEFALRDFVEAWVAEFARDRSVAAGTIAVQGPGNDVVKFEQSHLRQILFNLVDNALRYCSGSPGSVEIFLDPGALHGGRAQLWVMDDGVGVAPADRGAMFEPFFTTHARGTGLGLYLAREFCIANRAELAYEALRRAGREDRNGFVVMFARGDGDNLPPPQFLDTMPAEAELFRRNLS